jgi:hypothetical protein
MLAKRGQTRTLPCQVAASAFPARQFSPSIHGRQQTCQRILEHTLELSQCWFFPPVLAVNQAILKLLFTQGLQPDLCC